MSTGQFCFGEHEEIHATPSHVCIYFYHGVLSNFHEEEFEAPLEISTTTVKQDRWKIVKALTKCHQTYGADDEMMNKKTGHAMFKFKCGEQYIMCRKAILMNDPESLYSIFKATRPFDMKKLGRKVKNWNQKVWNDNVESIARDTCIYRLLGIPRIRYAILDAISEHSGKQLMIAECSARDLIWGTGMGISASHRAFKLHGKFMRANGVTGRNILGRAYVAAMHILGGTM